MVSYSLTVFILSQEKEKSKHIFGIYVRFFDIAAKKFSVLQVLRIHKRPILPYPLKIIKQPVFL